jgi:hypothetical protein
MHLVVYDKKLLFSACRSISLLDSARKREDNAEPERPISAHQQVLLLFFRN